MVYACSHGILDCNKENCKILFLSLIIQFQIEQEIHVEGPCQHPCITFVEHCGAMHMQVLKMQQLHKHMAMRISKVDTLVYIYLNTS